MINSEKLNKEIDKLIKLREETSRDYMWSVNMKEVHYKIDNINVKIDTLRTILNCLD